MKKKDKWFLGIGICGSLLVAGLVAQGMGKVEPPQTVSSQEQGQEDWSRFESIAQAVKDNKPKTVVGQVFSNGYLKRHGNHYHFVYGTPPADAIYEEESEKTLASQTADDHYSFNPADVVEETAEGYVVRHGDHFHFIYKADLARQQAGGPVQVSFDQAAHEKEAGEEEDHYQFNPADVVKETAEGYVVRHGDHFHFIYKKDLAQAKNSSKGEAQPAGHRGHDHPEGEDHDHHQGHDQESSEHQDQEHGHQHDHEDGFVFDPSQIISEDEEGYVIRHGDHTHYVYKKDLASKEEGKDSSKASKKEDSAHQEGTVEKEGKKYRLVKIPHGDHYHEILVPIGEEIPSLPDDIDDHDPGKKEDHDHGTDENIDHGEVDKGGNKTQPVSPDKAEKTDEADEEANKAKPDQSKPSDLEKDGGLSTALMKDLRLDSDLVQPYLDYIAYAYGVERDSIQLQDIYKDNGDYAGKVFVFQNMEQGQDKSHVHPWVIPMKYFQVPSSDPALPAEIRLSRELRVLAKRMGISADKIHIIGDKFEVPHGNHSHLIKILNKDGIQDYLANQLKDLPITYLAGDLNQETVIAQIQTLKEKAKSLYGQEPLRLERLLNALEKIQDGLVNKDNSTQGYLATLKRFEEVYIDLRELDKKEEPSQADQALNALYEAVVKEIGSLNLEDYSISQEELRQAAMAARNSGEKDQVELLSRRVKALKDSNDRPGLEGMRYIYFFAQHLFDKELSADLREKVAKSLYQLSQSDVVGEEGLGAALFYDAILIKEAIFEAHAQFKGQVDATVGPWFEKVTQKTEGESDKESDSDDEANGSEENGEGETDDTDDTGDASNEEAEAGPSILESMKAFADAVLEPDQKDDSLSVSDFRN